MSVCNHIQIVTPDTCIGDSLVTFNNNFESLNRAVCDVPNAVPGIGTIVGNLEISEQQQRTIKISTNNSFTYSNNFEAVIGGDIGYMPLANGTAAPVTFWPLATATNDIEPKVVFSTVSLTHSIPKVTLYWTASGSDTATIYTTNSATSSVLDMGTNGFNFPVTTMLLVDNLVYVGGEFTSVAGVPLRKLCVLDLNLGTQCTDKEYNKNLKTAGVLAGTPLSANGGFGLDGEIRTIAAYQNLLIFGGTYNALVVGRGLTVYNKDTGQIYPFYVNGSVNAVEINGTDLYVGGSFDYINYGYVSTSESLGLRTYTNGLIKISLSRLISYPNNSIDTTFAENIQKQFSTLAVVNTIATKNGTVYIGGSFQAYQNSILYAANIAIVNPDGTTSSTWRPIVTGEVYKLAVVGDYLYVGGTVTSFLESLDYFNTPRPSEEFYHALCFLISTPTFPLIQYNWKPKFNGPVTSFVSHDESIGTPLYCYGMFTEVNGNPANHLTAISKSFENSVAATDLYDYWRIDLNVAPKKINQGIIRYPLVGNPSNSLLIAGNFTQVNGKTRKNIARVSGAYETIYDKPVPKVVIGFGGQVCGPGSSLNMDLTTYYTLTTYPMDYGTVVQTPIPNEITLNMFKHSFPGCIYKFFAVRPRNSGTLLNFVNILGWKVDFN